MTENTTTPVPSDLLARIAAASSAGKVEDLRGLVAELPAPPAPRLVLINLDAPDALHTSRMWPPVNHLEELGRAGGLGALLSRIDHAPDFMAVIEEQITEWWSESDTNAADLVVRLRNALTAAVQ